MCIISWNHSAGDKGLPWKNPRTHWLFKEHHLFWIKGRTNYCMDGILLWNIPSHNLSKHYLALVLVRRAFSCAVWKCPFSESYLETGQFHLLLDFCGIEAHSEMTRIVIVRIFKPLWKSVYLWRHLYFTKYCIDRTIALVSFACKWSKINLLAPAYWWFHRRILEASLICCWFWAFRSWSRNSLLHVIYPPSF